MDIQEIIEWFKAAKPEPTERDLCKKVLPPTAETKTKIFSCFHPKSLLIRLKYPLNPPWIPD